MIKKSKIVRNHAVFCALSKLIIYGGYDGSMDLRNRNNPQVDGLSTEYILRDIFNEKAEYNLLLNYYSEALEGRENHYFSFAHVCDKKHAVRIDEDNHILLYYYQDELKLDIPWDYPHLITCIGSTDEHSDLRSVVDDLKELSTLSFLLKYYVHKSPNPFTIQPTNDGFLVNDFLRIAIDEHITFKWTDSNHTRQEKYIADTWWETKKDIISDLMQMNLFDFGNKYGGFWGK